MPMQTLAAQRSRGGIEIAMRVVSARRPVRLGRSRWSSLPVRIGVFSCAFVLMAGTLIDLLVRSADATIAPVRVEAPPAPLPPQWIDIVKPIQLFGLAGSEFNRLALDYAARRRPEGRERQDVLTFGRFASNSPYLRLAVHRNGDRAAPTPDLFVALARIAADGGVAVTKSTLPTLLPSRFGPFATSDLTLAQGAAVAPCLGFQLIPPKDATAAVGIAGLACGTAAHAMDRAMLACVLDRIDLVSAGDDDEMRTFFVAAEQRRGQDCTPFHLLAAGGHAAWFDSASASSLPLRRLPNAPPRGR